MSTMGELTSLQAPLVQALAKAGWTHIPGPLLDRPDDAPFIESDLVDALTRLNPVIAEDPERTDEILRKLRTLPLSAKESGLVETNRAMAAWLRGTNTHQYVGTHGSQTVHLIDYNNPTRNRFVVSEEVRFGAPGHVARFDIVLWVNGLPVAVGELKTPTSSKVSWMHAATELVDHYQPGWPGFFTTNAVVFATEGKSFHYAGVGAPIDHWQTWGAKDAGSKLADVLDKTVSLLNPGTLLDMLANFTLFETPDNNEGVASLVKIVARYTQYEAVNLIVDRVKDPDRSRGLIFHTQGSGKTLAMVFAAGKLLHDPDMNNPTIVLIADRVQLVSQMWDQFRTTNMPRLLAPETNQQLQAMLKADQRGLVFTTVHKFANAPVLNTRSNIVVLVDEAHRTQEGDLGLAMRNALPNATLFAFTGTPIAKLDRNTFLTFGDEDDQGRTLHTYSSEESIRDGMTVPIHVAPRKVDFNLDQEALDEAFEQLSDDEDLTDEEQDYVASRAARASTLFSNPERIRAVCADIVEHFYSTVDPLGMKAQIVVVDRAACVAYTEELNRILTQRHQQQLTTNGEADDPVVRDEVAVVMTVGTSKGEPKEWEKYRLTDAQEAEVLKRFRTFGDPLKFLVCTSKLGTGFDAPIEGVLYLDKPLKEHTLFQTITRTNRNWRNPATGARKKYGTVVDYVGLGAGFGRAMTPAKAGDAPAQTGQEDLLDLFETQLADTMKRFAGINIDTPGPQTLMDAQDRMPTSADEEDFATGYTVLEGIYETLHPHNGLLPHRAKYRFLSQVYDSIQPSGGIDDLLWHRVGVKTLQLVHSHMHDIAVTTASTVVIADAESVQALIDEGLVTDETELAGKTAADVIDSIAARLKKRLAGDNGDHPVYKSLAERLEKLRQRTLAAAEQSIEWLKEAFTLARDLKVAEKADDDDGVAGLDLLPDPRVGALTQIFREYAPDNPPKMIERIVNDVDAIVRQVRYDGWAATTEGDQTVRRELRTALRKHQMHTVAGLFESAYAYIAEHY